MRLYVPEIGDELKLVADWRFKTVAERRNSMLFDVFEVPDEARHPKAEPDFRYASNGLNRWKYLDVEFQLPAGTILKLDRVYIRKGAGDYSSLTFYIIDSPDKRVVTKKKGGTAPKAVRFWVNLPETRNIEFEG